jgi:hypothetical protein
MYLQGLFDELVIRGEIPESRKGPAKTAIKQYADILGYNDPGKCPHEAYNLPETYRKSLIEARARRTYKDRKHHQSELGVRAVINIKNNVSYILKKAVSCNLLLSPEAVKPLSETHRVRNRVNPKGYTYFTPGRNEYTRAPKYGLRTKDLPQQLASELEQYHLWTTTPYNPQRPEKLTRRIISADTMDEHLRLVAGFLVNNVSST